MNESLFGTLNAYATQQRGCILNGAEMGLSRENRKRAEVNLRQAQEAIREAEWLEWVMVQFAECLLWNIEAMARACAHERTKR